MKRHTISFDKMDPEEIYFLMTEGSELAGYYLSEIVTKHSDGQGVVLDLDDMNIRGTQIVIGVQICNYSLKEFVKKVLIRDPWLVQRINAEWTRNKAVERGASFTEVRE